jgi:hypothetical protein
LRIYFDSLQLSPYGLPANPLRQQKLQLGISEFVPPFASPVLQRE